MNTDHGHIDKTQPSTFANDNDTSDQDIVTAEGLFKRCVRYFHSKVDPVAHYIKKTRSYKAFKRLEDSKFFPKFMAAKGGISSIFLGVALLPAAIYHGTIIGAVVLASCAVGLLSFGAFGMLRYGGYLLQETRDLVRTRILGKPPLPKKSKVLKPGVSKKDMTPWGLMRNTKMAEKFEKSKTVETIRKSAAYKYVKNHKLVKNLAHLGRDRDVIMRIFATGGALTTIALSAVFMASQAITISAVTLSAAGALFLYTAGNLVAGLVAFGTHGFYLFDSSKKVLRKNNMPKTEPGENLLKISNGFLKIGKFKGAFAAAIKDKAQNDNNDFTPHTPDINRRPK